MIKWGINEYVKWKNSGCPFNDTVIELDCSWCSITTLSGIENLTKLTILKCYDNKLTSLSGIENLVNLTKLNCSGNKLTTLFGIKIWLI